MDIAGAAQASSSTKRTAGEGAARRQERESNSTAEVAEEQDSTVEVIVEETGGPASERRRLEGIAADLRSRVPPRKEFAAIVGEIIRDAVDYVIDAPRMKRYSLAELEPDEKTTIGKRIERLIRIRFGLPRGTRLDVALAGEDVDIKTSCTSARSWMFSKSNVDHVNLLIAYDETTARFDLGLVLVTEDILGSHNQDKKRGLKGPKGGASGNRRKPQEVDGRILWVLKQEPYPPNFLAQLPPALLAAILSGPSGAARVRNLFSTVVGVPVPRHAIASLANQRDPKRRDRGPDGARGQLWKKGLLVLSGTFRADATIAAMAGVSLAKDETMSLWATDRRLSAAVVKRYARCHKLRQP
jgi:hypothetical protein